MLARPALDRDLHRALVEAGIAPLNEYAEMYDMSEDVKHTPGPWTAFTNDFGYIYDDPYCPIDGGKKAIAYVMLCDRARRKDIPEWEANARLIAAAPDLASDGAFLLARLREFEREIATEALAREWFGHVGPAIARFSASLTKATGSAT
jgi:hypothetical protein